MIGSIRSVPKCLHDGICDFRLPCVDLTIIDIWMSSIVHNHKDDLLVLVSPSHDTCRAIVSETVGHLRAGATSSESVPHCIVIRKAFNSSRKLLYN